MKLSIPKTPGWTSLRLFFFLGTAIVVSEFIMEILPGSARTAGWQTAIADSVVLVAVSFPILSYSLSRYLKSIDLSLRESEERFRGTFDQAAVGIAHVSPDGKFLEVNDRWCTIVGYSREELRTISFQNITHPDDLGGSVAQLKSLVEGKTSTYSAEKRYLRKDQSIVWVNLSVSFLRDPTGARRHFISVIEDITDRKRVELEREAMDEIIQGVAGTSNLDELFKLAHQSLKKVLYAENFFVALYDQTSGLFGIPYAADKFNSGVQLATKSKGCIDYVFRTSEPALITPEAFRRLQETNEVDVSESPAPSWIGAPLRTPSRTVGILVLQHHEREDAFGDRDLRFLASVGNQLAGAVERKEAEAALRDSQTNVNAILESTADGILAVDSNGKVIGTNKRFAELWHIPQSLIDSKDDDGMLSWVLNQLIDPEGFLSKVRLLYGSADEDRDTLLFKDGRIFERYSAAIILEGAIVGRVWSFRDVTERKRAEANLTQALEWQQAIFEGSRDAIFVSDQDSRFVAVNNAACTLTGYSREQLLTMTIPDLHDHPDLDAYRTYHKRILQGEEILSEAQVLRKDGTKFESEFNNRSVSIAGHNYLHTTARNITDRKRIEEALLKSKQQYDKLASNIPVGIYLLLSRPDGHFAFQYVSPRMAEMLDVRAEEILDDPQAAFRSFHPDELEMLVKLNQEHIRTRKPFDWEGRVVVKGAIRWLHIESTPEQLEGGEVEWNGTITDVTERKRAEEALRESEEKFRNLFNNAEIGMFRTRVDGSEILDMNEKFLEIFDRTREEAQGAPSVIHWADPRERQEMVRLLNAEGRVSNFECRMRNKRGEVRSCLTSLRLYHSQGILEGSIIDITERKRAEEALRESERDLREAQHLAGIGSWHWIVESDTVKWSEELYSLNGRDPNLPAPTYSELSAFYTPESWELLNSAVTRALQTGTPYALELELLGPDKSTRYTFARGEVDRDDAGRIVGLHGTNQDITERKRAEEALTYERNLLKALLDNTPDQVYFKDKECRFLRISQSLADKFAVDDPLEAIGKTDFDFFAREHAAAAFEDERKIMNTGTAIVGMEEKESWSDGRETWVSTTKVPLHDEQGRIMGTFGISRDITERKQSEEALRQAQKLESIGTLAGGIAHDFNNLLNAVLGQSTIAIGKLPNESPAKNHIVKSIQATERAAELTRQLLAYSGKGKFDTIEIDLNRLVNENVQMLEVSVPKTAQINIELGSPSPHLRGDVGQIQQVIMNLIINAGEALGPNPGYITLRTNRIELTQNSAEYWKYTNTPLAPGMYAMLQVSDTGHGMKSDVMARIFDPFFTTKFSGRGLGLAAVLGIIRGHQGGVRITSEEGRGTRFEVVFPLVETTVMTGAAEAKTSPTVNARGKSVLVIDDEPAVLELLTDIFTEAGITVMSALDPMDGIELYRQHHRDIAIVVLDYSMPGMNGKTAFEKLIQIDKDVKVLLCSGFSEEETVSAFGADRPEGFIQKPYQPAALMERISRVLAE